MIPTNEVICEFYNVSEMISLEKAKMKQELDLCYSDIIKYLRNRSVLPDSEIKQQQVKSILSLY